LIKFFIFGTSLIPLAFLLTYGDRLFTSNTTQALAIIINVLSIPLLVIFQVGILYRFLPKSLPGKYSLFSPEYYKILRLQETNEIILNSSFINNIVNRIEIIRNLIHSLLGVRGSKSIILAPDVVLLDPHMLTLGKDVFIGSRTILSPHLVMGNYMLLQPITIGDRVLVGAYCTLSYNTEIGEETKIDYGVEIYNDCRIGSKTLIYRKTIIYEQVRIANRAIVGSGCELGKGTVVGERTRIDFGVEISNNCKIGRKTRIHRKTFIDSRATVEDRVTIGSGCRIGEGVIIGSDSEIGSFCVIEAGCIIPSGTKLKNLSVFSREALLS
jgi:acetyltransferase-like isoleucine patch superfamily enzyme